MAPKRSRKDDPEVTDSKREAPLKEIQKRAKAKMEANLRSFKTSEKYFKLQLSKRVTGGFTKTAIRSTVNRLREKYIMKSIRAAFDNIVVVHDFCLRNFQDKLDAHNSPEANDLRKALGDRFRDKEYEKLDDKDGVAIVDCEGELLLLQLPKMAAVKFWNHTQETLQAFLSSNAFHRQSCSNSRGGDASYLEPTVKCEDGYSPGMQHLAYWHEIGHTHEPPKVSTDLAAPARTPKSDTTKSTSALKKVISAHEFLGSTQFLQEMVNATYECVAPSQARRLIAVRERMNKDAATSALMSNQGCHLHSLAVLSNKWTGDHIDDHSDWRIMDSMIAGGDFTGGELFLSELKMELPFNPGDIILIMGRVLTHGTCPWQGKKRASLVYFVHFEAVKYEEMLIEQEAAYRKAKKTRRLEKKTEIQRLE